MNTLLSWPRRSSVRADRCSEKAQNSQVDDPMVDELCVRHGRYDSPEAARPLWRRNHVDIRQ